MIGKTLGGRYSITRRLGGGGFSDTYLAVDKQLPKTPSCVVKRLKAPQAADSLILKTVRRLFDAEAASLYELGRRNNQIPRLLAHFEEDKEFYLVQEFIEGKDLGHELVRGQKFPEEWVIALLEDILHVLEYVHQEGVIHRDIKPRNLIRRVEDNKIVLIDFGAVKQISTQIVSAKSQGDTTATIAVGTPGYMPNEQQGGKPRFSSDIYAVGMIAIQALTGLSPQELQDDSKTGEVIWREHAQVKRRLGDIIDKMVRTHFKDRYRSVEEVLADLQILQGPTLRDWNWLTATVVDPSKKTVSKTGNQGVQRVLSSRWAAVGATLAVGLASYGYWVQSTSNLTTTAQTVPGVIAPSAQRFALANTLALHTGPVSAIATSSDGETFVSGSEDKTIKVWNLRTGDLLRTLSGHDAEVVSVAISQDGQLLASGSRDNTVKLWDLQSGELIRTLDHPDWIQSVAFSPDGQMLAAGDRDQTVFVWNVSTGKLLCNFMGHTGEIQSVAISSDGRLLASGSQDKTIRVWDLQTEKRVHILAQHAEAVESVAFSPDGQTLISGGADKTLIWDLETGRVRRTLSDQSGLVRSLTISPDGQTLISSHQDNTIKLWDIHTGQPLRTLSGHLDSVSSVAVSPDGQTLVSGSRDNAIKIWEAQ
ncbi:serine/threonine protein kinase [Oculatella sp. FACHB-28]|uniref:serine/threonine-protein kinase n=1 Tax=Oculatella sp. FACHB-28 TaxID=2692845 RepID=UPI001687ABF1|nr:serine/threonine-protein kinase [Oculatella sp. FACHB-28]MBD2059096.1 serine/threonine protein kinase [Oculatella sp. FACHB-28]